jgi:uncharacterized membrane protein YhaH (DUF805 family)
MASETFEQVLTTAQAAGSLTAAWKKFVNTRFFVTIERSADNDPKNFALHLGESEGRPAVWISEVRERIAPALGHPLVAMSGAEVVRRLRAEGGILVALSEGVFSISSDRAEWLKKGVEAALARAADKARQPAPAPAPVALAKTPAAPPSTPVQRNQVGVLDVAALKPRNIVMPKIGLEFFVPGDWTESASAAGLRFADPERQTTVEASGFHRPNLSMAQWMDMRLTLVRHEMRYLTQDGQSYPFEGEGWRGRVQGMATEFAGTFPGDDAESRYLVACIWTDGVLASIAIRAPAATFEANRALYKWLLGRVDMNETAAAIYNPPASLGDDAWDEGETPPMFAFSLAGRMGRARVLAYTFPMGLAGAVVGILAAVLLPVSKVMGGIVVAAAVGALMWFCLRLMVLRMHDINLSGKWLLGTIGVLIMAAVTRNLVLLGVASLVFWLGSLVIYCFIPGTNDDNDYGAPPGPNSVLVNIGAGLFILLQLAQIGALSSGQYGDRLQFPNLRADAPAAPATPFTVPDGSFSVMLPGAPQEVKLPPGMVNQQEIAMHQYHLTAGGFAYMVQSVNYFDRMPENRFDAMDGMQELVVGKDGTLVEASPFLLKGTTGRQVKVSLPGGRVRAARFVVADSKLSMIMVTAPDAVKAGPAIDAFLASFKLN